MLLVPNRVVIVKTRSRSFNKNCFFSRFYRYVLSPELLFDEKGRLLNTASAVFHNMPQTAILTVNMDTPPSWMVEAVNSPYDLDNIHLAEVSFLKFIECYFNCIDSNTLPPQ